MREKSDHINYKISNLLIEYQDLNKINYFKEISISENKYIESNFSKDYSSFYNNESFKIKNFKFLDTEFISLSEKFKTKLFGNIIPENIHLGELPCSALINSLKILSEKPYLIKRLFESKVITNSNAIGVWLNIEGRWDLTILDDFFPCSKTTGNLNFSHAEENNILWLPAIEKAISKQRGTYSDVCNNSSLNYIFELTGNLHKEIELNDDNIKNILDISKDKNNLLAAYKKDYLNVSQLEEINNYELYYIVNTGFRSNEKNDHIFTLTLRKIDKLTNYKDETFKSEDNRELILTWDEFKNEFTNICFWNIPISNGYNSVSFKNKNFTVTKLFAMDSCKIQLNICQETFEKNEEHKGLKDISNDNIISDIVCQLNKNHNPNFRKSDTNYDASECFLVLCKLVGNNEIEQVLNINFKEKLHRIDLDLEHGNYVIVTKTNWNYSDNFNYTSLSICSSYLVDLKNINENEENIFNNLESEYWRLVLEKEKNLIHSRENILFLMGNKKILTHEYKLESHNCHIFEVISELDEKLKIILKSNNSENCKFLPLPLKNKSEEIIVQTNGKMNGIIVVKSSTENLEDLKINLEFQGFEILDKNMDLNHLNDVFSCIKNKDNTKVFYMNLRNYEEGCGCRIF